MRTDTIFYQLFQTFPELLFELIGESPEQAQQYEFSSREIKELARRFDGIFLPNYNQPNLPIYFVEIQFQTKADFYWRFFAEIFVYLGQYQPEQDFCAVAVFASRRLDTGIPRQYRGLVRKEQVKWVYLDELINITNPSLSLAIVQLVLGTEELIRQQIKPLLSQAQTQLNDEAFRVKVIELIETILIYKFRQLSREEIITMFGLGDLKQTRFYQEAKEEGKLESIPGLLALGLSVEQIAQALGLEVTKVQQVVDEQKK